MNKLSRKKSHNFQKTLYLGIKKQVDLYLFRHSVLVDKNIFNS